MTLEVTPRCVDLAAALGPHAAAEWLLRERGIERKPTTLAKLRSQGGGPSFYRIDGSVRYLVPDLDAYARSLICGPLRTSREPVSNDAHDQKNEPPGQRMSEGREIPHANRNLENHGDTAHVAGLKRTCKAVACNRNDGNESVHPD
jgi:hypothetical protein